MISQEILLVLHTKYVVDMTTSHYLHCYYSGIRYHRLSLDYFNSLFWGFPVTIPVLYSLNIRGRVNQILFYSKPFNGNSLYLNVNTYKGLQILHSLAFIAFMNSSLTRLTHDSKQIKKNLRILVRMIKVLSNGLYHLRVTGKN